MAKRAAGGVAHEQVDDYAERSVTAAELSDAAQETGQLGNGGGVGSFPSPEEPGPRTAHRHAWTAALLTGPAAAAGSAGPPPPQHF